MKNKILKDKMNAYLCPPGNGVFTVNTAKERKEVLHKKIYGQTQEIETQWQKSLENLDESSKACILGICSDTGGGILRGANWGPLFLRLQLLNDYPELVTQDLGDVRVIPHLLHDKYLNDPTIANCRKALYGEDNSSLPVSSLSIAEDFVSSFYENYPKKGLFSIGGDHSVSYPLVKSYLQSRKKQGIKAAVIHFDAHTDLLVERLGIDICFGSWATHILGDLESPDLLFQIGIRSSGRPKEHWESTFGVRQFWANEVLKQGPSAISAAILKSLKEQNVDELYVSFDIDALDAKYASATGTPEIGGLAPHDAMVILKELEKEFPIKSADMVEIAPFLATENADQSEPDSTLAVGASLSAFMIEAINRANT
ncbi:arginase family protein [Halobacteriovorax sp. GB3]|uniref:arginase family protein n=1 Tax=Halobacteriovorax sp. GB3 TaxID=2719615 RepID=UPI00235E53A4|nr:arginase family protein [Halobacteriovorax sp. GB3]MDD0853516.1 arginase family protein [Halobacteriovorax sp. GB3]